MSRLLRVRRLAPAATVLLAALLGGAPAHLHRVGRARAQAGGGTFMQSAPLWVAYSTPLVGARLTPDPTNPARIAYCVPGGIQVTEDGGASWQTVSTAGAAADAASSTYPLFSETTAPPACVSALPAPGEPGALYATFPAAPAQYGAPPIVFVAYQTLDAGQSWTPVPLPDSYPTTAFGGLQAIDGAVQSLYGLPATTGVGGPAGARALPEIAVEAPRPDGSWAPTALSCPAIGPCVRWGPAPNEIGSCAMNGHYQLLAVSGDGGASWQSPTAANACDVNQLAALPDGSLVLVSGRDERPLRVSTDGGFTWADVALPALPDAAPGDVVTFPGLRLLPDGTLFAHGEGGWWLLPPGAASWCAATLPDAALTESVRPIGDRLWWLSGSAGAGPLSPASLPLDSLGGQCGGT